MHTLYQLTFSSGKRYIGQTVRKMKTRLTQHRHSAMHGNSQLPVHCAWRKYGEPECIILGNYETHEELHRAEIEAIRECATLVPNGYNLHFGGTTSPALNPIVADKIGKKSRGRKIENTENMSAASKKMWEDPEYREHVSAGLRSAWTQDMRDAASLRFKAMWDKRKEEGWAMPESQKQKMRDKIVTDEARINMSAAAKGRRKSNRSESHRAHLSEAAKKTWATCDNSQRIEAMKAAWDDEARANMAKIASELWKDPEIRAKRIAGIKSSKSPKS